MTALHVLSCGPATSLQDRGRFGWQRFGIGPAGAMDAQALALANLLVGNAAGTGAIEFALAGGRFRLAGGRARVALAGPDCVLRVDGRPIAALTTATVEDGQTIDIGAVSGGIFAYLAVAGGLAVAPVLGSVALHLRAGIGGLDGRPLRTGDRLPLVVAAPAGPDRTGPALPPASGPIRVLPGPQDDHFTAAGIATFLGSDYTVSPQSDRMGLRLLGAAIAHGAKGTNIVSDGIATGAIQVPGSGEPLVLLADRQTTGGYPKIATVISADLGRLAQSRPGAVLRFAAVTRAQAVSARRAQAADLVAFQANVRAVGSADLDSARLLGLSLVDGWIRAED